MNVFIEARFNFCCRRRRNRNIARPTRARKAIGETTAAAMRAGGRLGAVKEGLGVGAVAAAAADGKSDSVAVGLAGARAVLAAILVAATAVVDEVEAGAIHRWSVSLPFFPRRSQHTLFTPKNHAQILTPRHTLVPQSAIRGVWTVLRGASLRGRLAVR